MVKIDENKFAHSTILIVEDDLLALEYLVKILEEYFLKVVTAVNGAEALEKFMKNKIDIILTDIHMPIQNGIDFVEKIRAYNICVPIVYMSAYAEVDILMQTMKHSANGFLLKPIKLPELFQYLNDGVSKVKQLQSIQDATLVTKSYEIYGGAVVNLQQQTVMLENKEIFLSKKEIKLLELLLLNNNAIISKDIIEDYLWMGNPISHGSVKTLVNKLREKVGKDAVVTIKNIGYKINLATGKKND